MIANANSTATIPLTQGKFAVVDAQDSTLLAGFRWTAIRSNNTWYAKTHAGGKTIYMHRLILFGGAQFGDARKADHINGNGLDNRRENLRPENGDPESRPARLRGRSGR